MSPAGQRAGEEKTEEAGEDREIESLRRSRPRAAGFEDREWGEQVEAENNWSRASEETGMSSPAPRGWILPTIWVSLENGFSPPTRKA